MIVNTGKNTSRIPIKSEIFKHASDFKRVGISQMNGGLKEKSETLIIIGNGFDLHYEMKIKYSDYREYLLANGNESIVKCFEEDSENDSSEQWINTLWGRMEEIISVLPYENAYVCLLNDSEALHNTSFSSEVKLMTKYWPGLKDELAPWIKSIEYTKKDKRLCGLINNNSKFISFN